MNFTISDKFPVPVDNLDHCPKVIDLYTSAVYSFIDFYLEISSQKISKEVSLFEKSSFFEVKEIVEKMTEFELTDANFIDFLDKLLCVFKTDPKALDKDYILHNPKKAHVCFYYYLFLGNQFKELISSLSECFFSLAKDTNLSTRNNILVKDKISELLSKLEKWHSSIRESKRSIINLTGPNVYFPSAKGDKKDIWSDKTPSLPDRRLDDLPNNFMAEFVQRLRIFWFLVRSPEVETERRSDFINIDRLATSFFSTYLDMQIVGQKLRLAKDVTGIGLNLDNEKRLDLKQAIFFFQELYDAFNKKHNGVILRPSICRILSGVNALLKSLRDHINLYTSKDGVRREDTALLEITNQLIILFDSVIGYSRNHYKGLALKKRMIE